MDDAALHDLLASVSFCAGGEAHGRYATNGVLLELGSSVSRAVGTGGKRLALRSGAGAGEHGRQPTHSILSMPFVKLLGKAVPADEDARVNVIVQPHRVSVEAPGVTIAGTLVEGPFPPFDEVIRTRPPPTTSR